MTIRREALLSAAVAGTIAALLAWLGPPGSDFAAHAYQRAQFIDHGFTLWNNFWYAGRYSFITYSVIYYPLAALLGIKLLAVATIALAALAFAVVLWREWGPETRWSSRTFAIVWAGIVLSAAFPFALGMALALLAIWALQAGARWRFAALAVLTLAASPLAFFLFVLVLAGIAGARRDALLRNWPAIASVVVAGLVEVVLWRMFPDSGRFPFPASELASVLAFAGVLFALTWGIEHAQVLRVFFAIYLATILALYLIPSAVGGNIARVRFAALPLLVLVCALRSWRPRWICATCLALALSWNVSPLVWSYIRDGNDATAKAATWTPAVGFLRTHLGPGYRVEAVDTATHFAAAYLAEAGIPLARGWYRQDDFPQNEVLYSNDVGRSAYVAWLHRLGVRYVVLVDAPTDYSSKAEAKIVRGFRPVFHDGKVTVYAVPHPQPIAPGIRSLTESRIQLAVRPGTTRIAVRYSPYWHASEGCLSEGKDGMLRLRNLRARLVTITFDVSASRVLGTLAGEKPDCDLGR